MGEPSGRCRPALWKEGGEKAGMEGGPRQEMGAPGRAGGCWRGPRSALPGRPGLLEALLTQALSRRDFPGYQGREGGEGNVYKNGLCPDNIYTTVCLMALGSGKRRERSQFLAPQSQASACVPRENSPWALGGTQAMGEDQPWSSTGHVAGAHPQSSSYLGWSQAPPTPPGGSA